MTGLKYVQKTSKMGVTVDKMKHMVGSYAPKSTIQSYTTPYDDAPSGMMGRGSYHVNSFFTDDDENNHLKVSTGSLECIQSAFFSNSCAVSGKFMIFEFSPKKIRM